MAGLSVSTRPTTNSFANTFATPSGAVPGVAQANQSFSGQLQGSGQLNNATIAVPKASIKSSSNFLENFSNTPPSPYGSTPVIGTKPGTGGIHFTPTPIPTFQTAYKGQTFTDPNQLAQAQAKDSFAPIQYNGQVYNDPTSYANAVITDAKSTHDKNVSTINKAYENGLISFDQRQKLVEQNRTSLGDQLKGTLNSQRGYFNSISPNATQSGEKVLADQAQGEYAQGLGTLDTQQQQIGTDKSAYDQSYQNSLSAEDQNLLRTQDQAANSITGAQSAAQGILDTGTNNAIAYQNQVKQIQAQNANGAASAAASRAPQVTQYDPVQLGQSIASYAQSAQNSGLTPDQALVAASKQLSMQGIDVNSPQVQGILSYVYGTVNNGSATTGIKSSTTNALP